MAERKTRNESVGPVALSVLDRLIDEEPKSRLEGSVTYNASVAKLKATLRRDLENLLNTRSVTGIMTELGVETLASVYKYGLPDITDLTANFLHERERLLALIEAAVRTFEPRLDNVNVSILPAAGTTRVLRFVIEGMLRIRPAPHRIVFDAALELMSGEYEVMGDTGAG
jgi:type VI secretion system protein ImpF